MEFTIYFILTNNILYLIILKLSKKSISSRNNYSLCIEIYKMWFELVLFIYHLIY